MERLAESDPDSSRPLSEATKAALWLKWTGSFRRRLPNEKSFSSINNFSKREGRATLESRAPTGASIGTTRKRRLGDERGERAKEKVRQAQAC